MSFGPDYSGIYDALYATKDYPAEARFVLDRLSRTTGKAPFKILDLGCGTGAHAVEFARDAHTIVGVDVSPEMVRLANAKREALSEDLRGRLEFREGDIRSVRLVPKFDAVVSLFHVIGYMETDADVTAMLTAARAHLNHGGQFLFDFWHTPSVLDSPPPRPKMLLDGTRKVSREGTLQWDHARSIVNIEYRIHVEDSATGLTTDSSETHLVRYFHMPALSDMLAKSGFEVVRFGEWLTDSEPTDKSFGVYALCTAI